MDKAPRAVSEGGSAPGSKNARGRSGLLSCNGVNNLGLKQYWGISLGETQGSAGPRCSMCDTSTGHGGGLTSHGENPGLSKATDFENPGGRSPWRGSQGAKPLE